MFAVVYLIRNCIEKDILISEEQFLRKQVFKPKHHRTFMINTSHIICVGIFQLGIVSSVIFNENCCEFKSIALDFSTYIFVCIIQDDCTLKCY